MEVSGQFHAPAAPGKEPPVLGFLKEEIRHIVQTLVQDVECTIGLLNTYKAYLKHLSIWCIFVGSEEEI
jgi:hypothetical protein